MKYAAGIKKNRRISGPAALLAHKKNMSLCLSSDLVTLARDLVLDLLEADVGDLGIVAIDDLSQLLEGRALGLDVHEVDEDELEADPEGVDDVELPGVRLAEGLEGHGVGVLVEQQRDLDRQV